MEEWRQIEGFKEYEVSDQGRVRRSSKDKNNAEIGSECVLKERERKDGYKQLTLCENGVHTTCLVHRLVAEAFITEWSKDKQVHHIDGMRSNNVKTNLGCFTKAEHLRLGDRAKKSGLARRKPVDMYTLEGEFIRSFDSATTAELVTGCNRGHISDCCRKCPGRRSTGGYCWRFAGDEE